MNGIQGMASLKEKFHKNQLLRTDTERTAYILVYHEVWPPKHDLEKFIYDLKT